MSGSLLVLALEENIRRHAAEALRRYFNDLRRDGVWKPPADLVELHELLAGSLSSTQEAATVEVSSGTSDDDHMLNRVAAARLLGISVSTLDRLVALDEIPSRKLGRRRVFSRTALEEQL